MYLSDSRIRELLPDIGFMTPDGSTMFDPDSQIQPCSVDLRLGSVFWRPVKRQTIDLRKRKLLELQPRRNYRRLVLRPGQHFTLKPGQLLLGRIHERFTVPPGYAGEITGRSSFARLGLMIHCTGGFINPGWSGHMPLQLVNQSKSPIRIFPHIPICQIRFVKVEGEHAKLYGEEELQSKYMDDDGGPSYWWRDKRITLLQGALAQVDMSLATQEDILRLFGNQEPEVVERLERLIAKSKPVQLENSEVILDRFTKREDLRRTVRGILKAVAILSFPAALAVSLSFWFTDPTNWLDYALGIVTALCLLLTLYAHGAEIGDHLGKPELRKLEQSAQTQS